MKTEYYIIMHYLVIALWSSSWCNFVCYGICDVWYNLCL